MYRISVLNWARNRIIDCGIEPITGYGSHLYTFSRCVRNYKATTAMLVYRGIVITSCTLTHLSSAKPVPITNSKGKLIFEIYILLARHEQMTSRIHRAKRKKNCSGRTAKGDQEKCLAPCRE